MVERDRGERERERERKKEEWAVLSPNRPKHKKIANKQLFHFFGGKRLQKYVFSKIGRKSAINCAN
jgi:hypothetical protein